MKRVSSAEAMEISGGKTIKCKICKQKVTGGFWKQYWHCLKHSYRAVMPAVEIVALCFGLAAI